MIEWILFGLTILVAAFSGLCWHDYATARVPDEGIGAAVMGFTSALMTIPLAFAWVVSVIL